MNLSAFPYVFNAMKPLALPALVLALGTIGAPTEAQPTAPRVVPRSFDVASVKPNQTGGDSRRATASAGGKFNAVNVSLKLLISRAYGVPEDQIRPAPGWIDADTFDISARADTPLEMSREELRPCLQGLLAERFRLTIHHEIKEGSVLSLVVTKKGARLKEHAGAGSSGIGASTGSGKAEIAGTRTTMARLAEYLSGQVGRQVIDNTSLEGEYDFRVEWTTNEKADGPSIFSALEEQLGLKLNATRGPIDVIAIDRVEKASPN